MAAILFRPRFVKYVNLNLNPGTKYVIYRITLWILQRRHLNVTAVPIRLFA